LTLDACAMLNYYNFMGYYHKR